MLQENYESRITELAQNLKEFQDNSDLIESKNQTFSELFSLISDLESQEEYNILTQTLIEELLKADFDLEDFNQDLMIQEILKYTKPQSLNLLEKKLKEIGNIITNRLKKDQEKPQTDSSYYEMILEEQNLIAEKLEEIDFLSTQIKEESIMTTENLSDHLSVIIPTFINILHPQTNQPLFKDLESLIYFNNQALQETKITIEEIETNPKIRDFEYENDN